MTHSFQIPFNLQCADYEYRYEHVMFWDTKRAWFRARGYTLYQLNYHPLSSPPIPFCLTPTYESTEETAFPYAHFGGDEKSNSDYPSLAAEIHVRIHSSLNSVGAQRPYSRAYCMHKTSRDEVWP